MDAALSLGTGNYIIPLNYLRCFTSNTSYNYGITLQLSDVLLGGYENRPVEKPDVAGSSFVTAVHVEAELGLLPTRAGHPDRDQGSVLPTTSDRFRMPVRAQTKSNVILLPSGLKGLIVRILRLSKVMHKITCAYFGGGEDCFEDTSSTSTGVGRACWQTASTIVIPPATFTTRTTSVQEIGCVEFRVEAVSVQEFRYPRDPRYLRTAFTHWRSDEGTWVVRNRDEAIVGQVVGDGMRIISEETLRDVGVCMEIDSSIPIDPAYTVADFAIRFVCKCNSRVISYPFVLKTV
jgi:hypothetical protein